MLFASSGTPRRHEQVISEKSAPQVRNLARKCHPSGCPLQVTGERGDSPLLRLHVSQPDLQNTLRSVRRYELLGHHDTAGSWLRQFARGCMRALFYPGCHAGGDRYGQFQKHDPGS